jgi:hypothetical protein
MLWRQGGGLSNAIPLGRVAVASRWTNGHRGGDPAAALILCNGPVSHQARGERRAPETCALKLTVLLSPGVGPQAVLCH